MALVKVKPTSPGRRALVKVVTSRPAQGQAVRAAAREEVEQGRAATTTATSRRATRAAATSSTTASSTSCATRTASSAKVERLEYDPNRSAHLALLCYADGERRYIIAPKGLTAGPAGRERLGGADQGGQHAASAQHPGRHHDPLHRDAAGQGRADRACRRHLRAAARARRNATRSCGCAPARSASVHVDCRATIGEVGNEEHNLRSIGKAGRQRWRGIRPTVRGVAMNPVDHPHGGGEGKTGTKRDPVSPWGHSDQGLQDAQEQAHAEHDRAQPA